MPKKRFTRAELHRLRNDLPIRWVIEKLLKLPAKEIEGVYRFLCPRCGEFTASVNEKTNLSRCFRCEENFNTIELLMESHSFTFVESVKWLLERAHAVQPSVPVALGQRKRREAGTASNAEASCPARSFFSAASILERMMRS